MLFITLGRFGKKSTKQMLAEMQKLFEDPAKEARCSDSAGRLAGTMEQSYPSVQMRRRT